MAHAAVMATDKAALDSDACVEGEEPATRTHDTNAMDDDTVPLLYRGWQALGGHALHIPTTCNWGTIRLPSMSSIIMRDNFTISKVLAGYYDWTTKFVELAISIDRQALTPTMFVASDKLFVGWRLYHSQVGLPTRGLAFRATRQDTGMAECIYFDARFSQTWEPATNDAQAGCLAVLGAKTLPDTVKTRETSLEDYDRVSSYECACPYGAVCPRIPGWDPVAEARDLATGGQVSIREQARFREAKPNDTRTLEVWLLACDCEWERSGASSMGHIEYEVLDCDVWSKGQFEEQKNVVLDVIDPDDLLQT
ncbi:hypothetical protein HPB50_013804 [Hyalomma asiaticum]|uniref:Uncharacterized protein n=1 Tax=Hyalomma asiaticum TaxID=266040 RepID=A0ACB7SEE1_HYAAI|nr:hypothetical protein HPB50_013804 [Hyalomma asiaticum]